MDEGLQQGAAIGQASLYFGCDPEFFFEREGKIIGSERVLTKDVVGTPTGSKFVMDGVQVEFNPRPSTCRALMGNEMALAFRNLKAHLAKMNGVKASFNTVIEIDKKELDALSNAAKALGCAPSLNKYDSTAKVTADGKKDLMRSAGGHIHLGLEAPYRSERLVPFLDTFVGNTCVLIDRDPNAPKRRQHYGRAGEYRLPPHGLEYRTLSNFWLRSYQLMSFVMGLSRLAVSVLKANDAYKNPSYRSYYTPLANVPKNYYTIEENLFNNVNIDEVRNAINSNDLDLAKKNFEGVKKFLRFHPTPSACGLTIGSVPDFEYFAKKVQERGLEYWFPEDPIEHWSNLEDGHEIGWEAFLRNAVRWQRNKELRGL